MPDRISLSLERQRNRIHGMRNHLMLCLVAGSVLVTGCKSRQPASASHPSSVKHVSLRIFEVVDCTAGMVAMSVKGSAEKYCLAAKPVVDETDVRMAEASRDESGRGRLQLYFTLKTGERMRETTGRITTEHLRRHDDGKMGIVVDGTLIAAPTVRGAISDLLVIDGVFGWEEAVQVANSLGRE